jgi:hypothetical protein
MKKTKKSLRQTDKVKKTLSKIEFIEIFLKMMVCVRNKVAGPSSVQGGGTGRRHRQIEIFFSSPNHYICLKQR